MKDVLDLDRIDTKSYSLFWCGAEFIDDEDGAAAHAHSCSECQREMFERWTEKEAKPRVTLT